MTNGRVHNTYGCYKITVHKKGQCAIDLFSCVGINRLNIKIQKEKDAGNYTQS